MHVLAEQVWGRILGAQRQLWQCTVQIRIASGFTDVASVDPGETSPANARPRHVAMT